MLILNYSDLTAKQAAQARVNTSMPGASWAFLQFKWWNIPGLNCAVWYCHKQFNAEDKASLVSLIQQETVPDRTCWLNRLLAFGRPSILEKIFAGNDKIWITDLTVAEKQRSGKFPKLFHGDLFPQVAGITIKKVDGQDRPALDPTDICVDIIITFTTSSADPVPNHVFHREQLPDWTVQQRHLYGRHTTGPLFTHWCKI